MLTDQMVYRYKILMSWYEELVASLTASLATLPPAIVCEVYLAVSIQKLSFLDLSDQPSAFSYQLKALKQRLG